MTWWYTPGVSEFIAAIVGAVVGSGSAGVISWQLQRAAFEKDREDRAKDKKDADRALLLQTLYACMQSASDLHSFAVSAREAKARAASFGQPPIQGLSGMWAALIPHTNLPQPIIIRPEAITVLVDHREAELAMGALDAVAVHNSTLKIWSQFAESRRRFGEKVTVEIEGGRPSTPVDDILRNYPHAKELSDLAEGIVERAERESSEAKDLVKRLAEFIERVTGTKVALVMPGEEPPPSVPSSA